MSRRTATDTAQEAPAATGTGCFVYGVVDPDVEVPPGLSGLDGAPVRVVASGGAGVGAAVGAVALDRPPGRRAELVAYSEVLDALASAGPVVPVRFGSVLADERAVVSELLDPHQDWFHELLEEVRGRAQFNLRVTYVEEVVLREVVGADPRVAELRRATRDLPEEAAYGARVELGERVARLLDAKREEDADAVVQVATRHCAAWSVRPGGGLNHVVDVALLVDDDVRERFEEALEGLAEAVHERMRLRLVGPLAPYDFVGTD